MKEIRVIKTEKDYEEALNAIATLVVKDPNPESKEGEQLLLLSALVEDYESRVFPSTLPNPIDAIKFRMEQADLKPADLVQYIGNKGRVSEILSGKRQLTLDMVRALESGLGIPAKVLIQKPDQNEESQYQHWDTSLFKTMAERQYFGTTLRSKVESLKSFFSLSDFNLEPVALFRKTSFRSEARTDKNALFAWKVRVLEKAKKIKAAKYKHGVVDLAFMQNLIKLSIKNNSPILAQEELRKIGIKLVIEPHLPRTHLDGAAILNEKNNPVIGLTLRHDRLDNFWFTLMHELAHVGRHYNQGIDLFYDEKLQDKDGTEISEIDKEREADEWAEESILPRTKWEISPAKITPSAMAAQSLADELGVNLAVIAGIIRYKHQNYYYLNKIVNETAVQVRNLFPDAFKIIKIKWKT
ncbi:MAG: ImmA/IrrE family metallo-endopeptidase [Candidatus Paceibacterota bacterium]